MLRQNWGFSSVEEHSPRSFLVDSIPIKAKVILKEQQKAGRGEYPTPHSWPTQMSGTREKQWENQVGPCGARPAASLL